MVYHSISLRPRVHNIKRTLPETHEMMLICQKMIALIRRILMFPMVTVAAIRGKCLLNINFIMTLLVLLGHHVHLLGVPQHFLLPMIIK